MALQRFWSEIQNARSLFFGRMNEGIDQGRRADFTSLLDAAAQTADVWFTPELVKEYDPSDFGFLAGEERTKLQRAVDEFRQLTTKAQGYAPSREQIERGYDLFATINNSLARYFGEEPDLKRIVEATRSVPWPKYTKGIDYRIGTDSTNSPAVWIRLIVPDEVEIESPTVQAELDQVRTAYREALQKAGIEHWPYVTVRSESEVKAVIGGAA